MSIELAHLYEYRIGSLNEYTIGSFAIIMIF